ncbi:MFS transporter [Salmonella enterica]|nr:MFS transporter [Salmonella enterica]
MQNSYQISLPFFLFIVLTGAFLGQFDLFVVNVAAPSIQQSLTLSDTGLEMVVAGYAFMFAASLITGGRLGDLYGYRLIYAIGMLGFSLATLLCALSPNGVVLILSRLLQGCTMGLMLPQVLALLTTALPIDKRLSAMGWYGAATGLGSVLGQFAGGALVTWNLLELGWRWIFLITVPLGLLSAGAAWCFLPIVGSHTRKFDIPGALGLAIALGFIIGAFLTYGHRREIGGPVLMVCFGAILLIITFLYEQRLLYHDNEPVVDFRLFRISSFWRGLFAICIFMLYFPSFIFLLTNVLQRGLALSPLFAGLVFVPSGIAFIVSSLLFRQWAAQHQSLAIFSGCCVSSAGLGIAVGGMLFTASPACFLIIAVIITGYGNGLILPVLMGLALRQIPENQAGTGSALLSTTQQFSSALGISIFGTLFYVKSTSLGFVHAMGWCVLLQILCLIIVALITGWRK